MLRLIPLLVCLLVPFGPVACRNASEAAGAVDSTPEVGAHAGQIATKPQSLKPKPEGLPDAVGAEGTGSASEITSRPPSTQAPSAEDLHGRFTVIEGQRTLYLWGPARHRGFAHGYLLARDILDAVQQDFGRFIERVGGNTRMYDRVLLKRIIPNFQFDADELEEMRGIIEGIAAALPADDRIVDLLGRELTIEDLKAVNTVGDWMALGCSSVAVPGSLTDDGAPAVVRNFDFPGLQALLERQHVVVVKPANPERRGYVGVSHPGSIGIMTGMNRDGVFTSVHDVRVKPGLVDALKPRVPRLCVLRRFMQDLPAETAVESALERVRSWPTLFGNNLMVVTPSPREGHHFAGVLEYDKRSELNSGALLRTEDGATEEKMAFVLCTNHHRVRGLEEDQDPSCWRYDLLKSNVLQSSAQQKMAFADLVQLVDQAAFPRDNGAQRAYAHGTLHQAIGRTGARTLYIRTGKIGVNIRSRAWRKIEVAAALAEAMPAKEPAGVDGK